MSPELDERIQANFHELFGRLQSGIDVSDTWYGVIYRLCQALQATIRRVQAEHPELPLDFSLLRIKQKFGELRVYWCVSEAVHEEMAMMVSPLIQAACAEAKTVCEFCSERAVGRVSIRGYVVTACRLHAKESSHLSDADPSSPQSPSR